MYSRKLSSRTPRRAESILHVHRILLRKLGGDFQVTVVQKFDAYEFELFPINLLQVSR